MRIPPQDLRRRLFINYKGEEGLDYGGVARSVERDFLRPFWINTIIMYKSLFQGTPALREIEQMHTQTSHILRTKINMFETSQGLQRFWFFLFSCFSVQGVLKIYSQ